MGLLVAGSVALNFAKLVGVGESTFVKTTNGQFGNFISNENPTRLSQAALETLAVIAYRQPIARGQIASIRGVNVDTVVKTLLSRGLITEMFTDSETGAINYGTTETFLETLGINALEDLPMISPYLPGVAEATSSEPAAER